MSTGPSDLLLRLDADTRGLEAGLARANSAVLRHETSLRSSLSAAADLDRMIDRDLTASAQRQAQAFDKAGTALLGFGAVAAVGLGLAAREAMQWESAWAGVNKTVSGSTEQMAALESGLRDLALILPSSHEEIAAVAEAAGALGVARPAILGFTKTMIDLGNTTDLTAEQAATAIAQIATVMGTDLTTEVDNLGNALVALGNNGASTESQILDLASRIAGAGALIGLSEADVLAYASALTSMGIEAEAGGTAISQVFSSIAKAVATGGEDLGKFATIAGLSAQDFAAAFREGPAQATQLVVDGLARLSSNGENVFGVLDDLGFSGERVGRVLLSAAGASEELDAALTLSNDEFERGNALVEEAAKRYETTEAKIQLAKNALSDAGIEIGQALLPVLASIAGGVSAVATGFGNLPDPVQGTITALAGFAATAGLVIGAGIKIHGALERMTTQLEAAPRLAKGAGIALKGLGALSIAAGIVGTALAVEQLWLAIEDDRLDVEGLEGDLIRLGKTGATTGDLVNAFGTNLADLGTQIEDAAHGWDAALLGFGKEAGVQNIERLDDAFKNLVAGGDIESAADAFETIAGRAKNQGVSIEELTALFPKYHAEIERATVDAGLLADEQKTLDDSTDDLTPAQKDLAIEFGLTGQAAKDAAEDLAEMDEALGKIFDRLFGEQEAADAVAQGWLDLRDGMTDMKDRYQEAVDELNNADTAEARAEAQKLLDTLIPFTGVLEGNSREALANRDAIGEMTQKYLDQVESLDEVALGSDAYEAKVAELKAEFIRNAIESGFAREGVEKYAKAFDEVPTDVPTTIDQPGMDVALRNTGYLTTQLAALQGTTTHKVYVDTYWRYPEGYKQYTGNNDLWTPGDERTLPPGNGRVGDQSVQEQGAAAGTFSMPAGGGARGMGGTGRVAGGNQIYLSVDARDINPYRRESSEDRMRGLSVLANTGVLDAMLGGHVIMAGD